jgi:hypothetical protein
MPRRRFQDLPRTQTIECVKRRQKLVIELLILRDVPKPIDQCLIFGTKGFRQHYSFLGQLIDRFAVVVLAGLLCQRLSADRNKLEF